jgi:JmjC domain, hydroxylase
MFPPHSTPPGVFPSADGAAVACPLSVVEWLLHFFDDARAAAATSRCLHGVARPGDVVFVPHGWWHCVLNIGDTVAVTQNFVSEANLHAVLRVLRSRNAQLISGCPEADRRMLYDRFAAALRAARPELWAGWEMADAEARAAREARGALAGLFSSKPARAGWAGEASKAHRVACAGAAATPFKFGFRA